ncbi:MAG: acylphosphatase [Anaerolineales bacterium]
MADARAHVFVSGRVQGVNFRFYTRQQALRSRVNGWVRNLLDGRVEAVFEGEEDAVRRMVGWCRKGPPSAHVIEVEVLWEEPEGDLKSFEMRRTVSLG